MNKLIQKLYLRSCHEELRVLKPGNHSIQSKIIGMNHKRFEYVAKISSEVFLKKNIGIGEKIYQSALKCFFQFGENYNLGIILLCAPIFEISPKKYFNFKAELKVVLSKINEYQGNLILKAIRKVNPAGLKKYDGPGDVNRKQKLNFKNIMKIGSQWDRISKCYVTNYEEIIDKGLPFFELMRKRASLKTSTILLYLFFLSINKDSHLLRKYGTRKSEMVVKKAKDLLKRIKFQAEVESQLLTFDKYLKSFHYNPGTCADLTVTTLLISKIRDIFKFQI